MVCFLLFFATFFSTVNFSKQMKQAFFLADLSEVCRSPCNPNRCQNLLLFHRGKRICMGVLLLLCLRKRHRTMSFPYLPPMRADRTIGDACLQIDFMEGLGALMHGFQNLFVCSMPLPCMYFFAQPEASFFMENISWAPAFET